MCETFHLLTAVPARSRCDGPICEAREFTANRFHPHRRCASVADERWSLGLDEAHACTAISH